MSSIPRSIPSTAPQTRTIEPADLAYLTTAELRSAYGARALTPSGVVAAALAHAAATNDYTGAMTYLAADLASEQALASTRRWREGAPLGPLDGVPVTVSDCLALRGAPVRHGCAALAHARPIGQDSPPVARLKEAGAIVIGLTAMPDFGMLGTGVSSLTGVVGNPWNLAANPGGPAAGAAAALAAGAGWGSVGVGGAVGVTPPAAHCGLAALQPTRGRLADGPAQHGPRPGLLARTVAEVAELDAAVSRPDPRDWTSLPTGSATPAARFSGRGLRVGVLESMGYGFDVAEDVRARVSLAATLLHEAGAHVEQVAPPFRRNPAAPLDRLLQGRTLAQVAALPAPDRPRVLGAVTAWCADAARYSATQAAADGAAAQAATARFAAAVEPYDLVVSPVVPLAAFPAEWVGLDAAVPLTHLAFTLWWSQMGAPLATVCLGFDTTGHPIGVQLAGRRFADAALLSAAAHLERERDFILDWPITPRRGRTP